MKRGFQCGSADFETVGKIPGRQPAAPVFPECVQKSQVRRIHGMYLLQFQRDVEGRGRVSERADGYPVDSGFG